jgi:hypothetical protein
MKILLILCAIFLFLAVTSLPIGFYTFLRILITIGSVAVILTEIENGITVWIILFGLIAILFKPLLPVYLHDKNAWVPFDIICGVIFLIRAFVFNTKLKI